MSKWLIALTMTATAFAKAPPQPTNQPGPDPDLFRKDEQVFSSHIEFLYWVVNENALDYAVKMRSPAWSAGANNYASGKMEHSTYYIDPGFRFTFGFFRAPRYWEVWASYTRLTSRGKNWTSKPEAADEYLTGTWPQILTAPLTGSRTTLHFNYNVVDVMVDRYFIPNPHLRLRTFMGLTGTWMDQNWNIYYSDASANETRIQSQWKYGGVGPRMGIGVDWYWTDDIYFTGRGTFAVLMGPYRNKTRQTTNFAPADENTAIPLRNVDYDDSRIAGTMQFILGPSYQRTVGKVRMETFVGYELTAWANVQEVYRSTAGLPAAAKETWINTGILSLQGLTARISVDY